MLKKIEDQDRLSFLPKFFGIKCAIVENAIYRYADKYIDGYTNGFWDFYQAGKAPLMVWSADKEVEIRGDYRSYKTNPQTASLAVMMLALNHLAWAVYAKHRDFAEELEEAYSNLRDWLYGDDTEDEVAEFGIDRQVVFGILD